MDSPETSPINNAAQPPVPQAPLPTAIPSKPMNDGSQILGISLRGLIVLLLVLTVCVLSIAKAPISEQLNNIVMMVLGVYFGHTVGLAQGKQSQQ